MNVLMLSSSKYAQFDYLVYAQEWIAAHLNGITQALFIPYAGVSIDWDSYTSKVQSALPNYDIKGIHQFKDPALAIKQAQSIIVGGGNTFNLLHQLQQNKLIPLIQAKISENTPYIGWSAGSNICGLSIRTTNDMPIIEPESFQALSFIQAQLNPHYTDYVPENFHGETRDQRIEEFCALSPSIPVIGIREGSALLIKNNRLRLLGELSACVFQGKNKIIVSADQDLSEYL